MFKLTIYHVAKTGSYNQEGTQQKPFLTINQAAAVALAGDTIVVHEGEYREWVKPQNPGSSDYRRITYKAAEGENVVIKGSEVLADWEKVSGTVWKASIPNDVFGDYNPYQRKVEGDWVLLCKNPEVHQGDVYLNGRSLFEATSKDEVFNIEERSTVLDFLTGKEVMVPDPSWTKFVWYGEVLADVTEIYVNFHEVDPRKELVECNVRRSCFYPDKFGINYISVSGFEMCHAATPWTPPTAEQPGLIGPNWSKGWIIENNHIHDAKCSGISLGKESSTGNNFFAKRFDKPGYQYQLESVFSAHKIGWSKEKIGSHIVRNNVIHDCGQNGIVGHLGCVFSQIIDNHIYNIGTKGEFGGWEIVGIKFHAPIDVTVEHNYVHDCILGIWLDWQTQGCRVTRNILNDNSRDLNIEVSHGPYIVDHNILLSHNSLDSYSEGGAYVHNIIAGTGRFSDVLDRSTPYHVPHSTDMQGCGVIYGNDDRFYNNIFIGATGDEKAGTLRFEENTSTLDEYIAQIKAAGKGDLELFSNVKQPVYLDGNVYFNGAQAAKREKSKLENKEFNPKMKLETIAGKVYLQCELPNGFTNFKTPIHSTETLGRVRMADAEFDAPDGQSICLNQDYFQKEIESIPGPIYSLSDGENNVLVWE